jgi:putative spermidine/putrescine transport system permease protein
MAAHRCRDPRLLSLPAAVVAIAAFNDRALLAFPLQSLYGALPRQQSGYRDFQSGFSNGLIVMLASSGIALVIGTGFAIALDRYRFAGRDLIQSLLLAPLVVPHFTVGLGFLILAAQLGAMRSYAVVVACHVVLVLPFVLRSVYISLRNLDRRLSLPPKASARGRRASTVHHHAAAASGPGQRMAVRRDPVVQ